MAATRYFAAGLNSNDESQRRWTRNSAAQFLWVYARVSPDHVIQLVIKTLKASGGRWTGASFGYIGSIRDVGEAESGSRPGWSRG